MKKITMICMAALLLLAASCKKEKNEQINENGGEGLGFSVKTEVHSGDSKTYLLDRQVLWDTDDQIKVYNTNGDNAVFTYVKLVEEEDGTTAEFNSNDVTASFFKHDYRGYYPTDFDPTNYTLGQKQTYTIRNIGGVDRPTFAKGANPMMATDEPNEYLHFKNVLGILQLQFYSASGDNVRVKEIRVRSNKLSQKLWGTGSVNSNGEFVVTSGGSNTVILDCFDANVTLSHDASNPTSFFILLPPNTLNDGLEVDVVDSYGEFWITKTTNNNIINRSRIRKMPALSVKTCTSEDVQLWAVANANDHNKAPYWATKNLGAENPWSYGDYYQWGATSKRYTIQIPQSGSGNLTYNEATFPGGGYNANSACPYYLNGQSKFSKYTSSDQINQLQTGDDVVYQLSGGEYHIPNRTEFNSLVSNTTQTKISDNSYHSVHGHKYYGKGDYDDRFIFIPAAGGIGRYNNNNSLAYVVWDRNDCVYCWTANRYTGSGTNGHLCAYMFSDMSGQAVPTSAEYGNRWLGSPIRAIRTVN